MSSIQQYLIPHVEENIGALTDKEMDFVRVAEIAAIDKHIKPYRWVGFGRKPKDRKAMALAFMAKAVWNFPTTLVLIEFLRASPSLRRLCGWERVRDIPSESTFSRAFNQFSKGQLANLVHESIVRAYMADKAEVISRDATAIEAREKPITKPRTKIRGSRGYWVQKIPYGQKPKKRLDLQPKRSMEENMAELPKLCDIGAKRNSRGDQYHWIGYKLHLDVAHGDIPVSALLTSASTHDSQVAIPLMQMSSNRLNYLYEVADSAYDAKQIRNFSQSLNHIPIIDRNKRSKSAIPIEPEHESMFKSGRSASERVNSNLKDNYGGRFVRVQGATKVMAHLMFGIVSMTAIQLIRLLE
jgi:hypothetical protein